MGGECEPRLQGCSGGIPMVLGLTLDRTEEWEADVQAPRAAQRGVMSGKRQAGSLRERVGHEAAETGSEDEMCSVSVTKR